MSSSPARDEQLFGEALALPPADRAAFLARACADDDALRSRLEALLAAAESAAGFMESPPDALPAALPEEQIGRYRLLQKIGEGGCGLVYMAEQSEPVRRRVALKIIKLGMDTKEVIARFEAERQALALMDHPNIARVLDAGATASGRPYFVMELVRGIRITDYCDQHRLGTPQRLALFSSVCLAVQHAHQKGIIHRDLKPSNILVAHDDGAPVPKIIDFGIAKATQGRLTDLTLFTAFEQFIGTPAYMSPEQAEMSSLDVDTRSDIYSLGVLLYELLAGCPPFDPQTLRQAGIDEIRRLIREVEPPKPSTRLAALPGPDGATIASLRGTDRPRLAVQLRGDIDWIVLKALEKNRARRYETAGALAADITRHLHNEPVIARPPSTAYLLQKLVRRNRLAFTAAAAVLAALVLGLGLATRSYLLEKAAREREAQQRALAETGAERSRLAAAQSEQAFRFIAGMLTGVGPSVAAGRDTALLRDILARTVRQLEASEPPPEVELNLRAILGSLYLDLGDYARAETMTRTALALADQVHGRASADAARALALLSQIHLLQGRGPEAEPLAREALTLARQFPGTDQANLATALYSLGSVQLGLGQLTEAESLLRETLTLARLRPDNENLPPDLVQALLASVLQREGRLADAEALLQDALRAQQQRLGADHPNTAYTQLGLSNVLMSQGKLPEAEAQFREAHRHLGQSLGPEHPTIALVRFNLAFILHQSGRLAEAETQYRDVLALQTRILGPNHPATRQTEAMLAQILEHQRKLPEAETVRQAAATAPAAPGMDADVAAAAKKTDLAMAAMSQQKFSDAETHLREALPVLARSLGDAHQAVVGTRQMLAQALLLQGKPAEAEPFARELLVICRQAFGPQSAYVAQALSLLVSALQAQDRLAEAEPLGHEALAIFRGQTTDGRNPGVAALLLTLASLKAQQGDPAARDTYLADAVAMMRPLPEHLKNALYKSVEMMANTLKEQGRLAAAVAVEQTAVAAVRGLFGEDSTRTAEALTTLAWLTNTAGDPVAGEAIAREAVAICRRVYPADHWQIAATEFTLAESILGQKKYPEAEALYLAVLAGLEKQGPAPHDLLFSFWRDRLKYTARHLARICEATGRAEQAATWKTKAAAYAHPEGTP